MTATLNWDRFADALYRFFGVGFASVASAIAAAIISNILYIEVLGGSSDGWSLVDASFLLFAAFTPIAILSIMLALPVLLGSLVVIRLAGMDRRRSALLGSIIWILFAWVPAYYFLSAITVNEAFPLSLVTLGVVASLCACHWAGKRAFRDGWEVG